MKFWRVAFDTPLSGDGYLVRADDLAIAEPIGLFCADGSLAPAGACYTTVQTEGVEPPACAGSMTAVDTTTSPTAGTLYHLVMTDDGTTLRLYVNGVQTATQSVSGSYSGYGSPYFLVGATQANATRTTVSNSTFLLANIAWAAWTAAEVMGRYLDPFGFLDYPDDDLFSEIAGPSVVGKSPRVRRVTFFY